MHIINYQLLSVIRNIYTNVYICNPSLHNSNAYYVILCIYVSKMLLLPGIVHSSFLPPYKKTYFAICWKPRGVCRISRGGANFKISEILDIHAAERHVAAAKLRAFARGLGGMPPKKIF